MSTRLIKVVYVTSSRFKIEENKVFVDQCKLLDGRPVRDVFEFEIRSVPIKETLEVNLETMVRAEVVSAYQQIKVPCVVEHAGLVFEEYLTNSYPGGLTKPMWNALEDKFVSETGSANRRAIARAVVAFCDGMSVHTFVGETQGTIAPTARGSARFYWDTVFVPDDPTGTIGGKTYAEIVDDPTLGREYKMRELSQSSRAMLQFLEHRKHGLPETLWGITS